MNPNLSQTDISKPCRDAHRVDGVIPQPHNLQFADRTCDCGKLIFKLVPCGCPGNPHDELKSEQNPNYIPS
jgi:hypothetical protein